MSGWTNQIPFPFIVVDPTTGNPIFVIDSTGAHVISSVTGINLIQGTGGPPPAILQFSDLSGANGDPAEISSQLSSGGMSLFLESGTGTTGIDNGGSSFLYLGTDKAVLNYQDITGTGGSSRLDLGRNTIDVTGTLEASGETWNNVGLLNGWVNRAGWDPLSYRIDPTGRVFLRGSISGGTSASGTQIGTIPAGYRPATHDAVNAIASDNLPAAYAAANGSCRLQVQAGGAVFIYGTGVGPLYFEGFSYSTL